MKTTPASEASSGGLSIRIQPCLLEVLRAGLGTVPSEPQARSFTGLHFQIFREGTALLPVTAMILGCGCEPGEGNALELAKEALAQERAVEGARWLFGESFLPITLGEDAPRLRLADLAPLPAGVLRSLEEGLEVHVQPCLFRWDFVGARVFSKHWEGFDHYVGYRLQILCHGRRQLPVLDGLLAPYRPPTWRERCLAKDAEDEEWAVERVREHFKDAGLPVFLSRTALRISLDPFEEESDD